MMIKLKDDKSGRYVKRERVELKDKSEENEEEILAKKKIKRKNAKKKNSDIKSDTSSTKTEPKVKKDKKIKTDKVSKPKVQKLPKEPKSCKKKTFSMMTSKTKIMDEDCPEFLNSECTKTFCDKLHNFSLKFKEQNNQEFARRYFTVFQDFTVLEPFQRKLYGNAVLDLMFIVDCTGSMSSWIEAVKTELKSIIGFIKENNPYSSVRISFVGYRDFDQPESSRYEILSFTEDVSAAKDFISKVNAMGGADTPEDLAGGLKKGLEQNWAEKSAKYCILICDAPCHGEKYHHWDDSYPKGDPNGLIPEDLIAQYANLNITFYAVKIKDYTDKMFGIFSDKYQEITKQPIVIANLGKSIDKFAFLVAVAANSTLSSVTVNNISLRDFLNALQKDATISNEDEEYQTKLNQFVQRVNTLVVEQENENGMIIESIEKSLEESKNSYGKNQILPTHLSLIKNVIVNKHPNFYSLGNAIELEAVCHSFFLKKDRHTNINWKNPFIQHSEVKSKITIGTDPFSEGCNRLAFYMKDKTLEQNLVAKLPKSIKASEYSIDGLKKELEAITICQHLVSEFNERVVNMVPDTRLLFNFINCYIYEILNKINGSDTSLDSYNLYTVENYIEGEYVKYNNNAGWISQNVTDQVLLAQTFSHFSWQITKGYLCVVDLQGVGGYLTDPQIHCLNPKKFGNGNFGYIGIMKFFMSHNCNSYCRKLDLIHPKNVAKIDKDYQFFVDKYISPENPHMSIYKLCSLCKGAYQTNALDAYNLKKKCWEGFCNSCDEKRKKSFKGATCSLCQKFFKSSAYVYKMKRNEFPDKCQKCTQDDRNRLREDYYKQNLEEEEQI
jgi:hypothetical protein